MKKIPLLGLVLVLLAFAVAPVMAKGPNHGNGSTAGQNNSGNQDQSRLNGHGRFNKTAKVGKNQANSHKQMPFYLQGTIKAINASTMTLTITLTHGNSKVKQFIGTDLNLTAAATTQIFKITQGDESVGEESEGDKSDNAAAPVPSTSSTNDENPGNRVPITFSQLAVGDKVAIHGNVVGGAFQARLITVYVNQSLGQTGVENP